MKIIGTLILTVFLVLSSIAQRVASTHFFYFESSATQLKDSEVKKLTAVCDTISNFNVVSISISGHTDDTSTEEENMILSESRAKTVKDILLQNNLPEDKINIVAMGETNPIESNKNEKGKARNRRVEVKVVYE